ncbi:MAG: dynamin family protein, partial [Verrucomicrobia bacterium]|nr:dynamin family protein [Verrucomicrobiota bacterium]
MKLHLSESTHELLEFLDGTVFPVWNSPTAEDIDSRLVRSMNRIQACRREFDARLFFIVVFGPLKSGKSTLVNTLARQYVSPTRFARESTRRASIVIRGKKSGIQQYFWKHETPDSSPDERKEAFERVIQYLRGVLTLAILEPDIQIVDQAYDKQAVDRLLAGPLEREPLITVIRCPGGQLIGEEISVLDVPGLDGFMTNTENNPAAFWIIDKSDLLIFTQSSFAPLNNQTSKYLRDLYDGSRKPPVLLVQNQIEARHWADPLEQQRETD